MSPQTATAAKPTSQWAIIAKETPKPILVADNETQPTTHTYTQTEAMDIILKSSKPIIVITKDSAPSYGGMMKYISESFPNVPIMVEDGGNLHDGPVCDSYMAGSSLKGNMLHSQNMARFKCADTIIIFGNRSEAVHAFANINQTVLSDKTVKEENTKGVNIAIAAFSDTMKNAGNNWHHWNTKPQLRNCLS